jgi:hypothetical protein
MKTTIELAREAGFETMLRKGKILGFDRDGDYTEELKAFEALVRADQREIDAKVCEELVPDMSRTANDASVWDVATFDCAAAIRARGN